MERKYKIADSCGGFLFGGKTFTRKQAQRLANQLAKKKNAMDFKDGRQFWQGVVTYVDPDISLRDEAYFRVNIAAIKMEKSFASGLPQELSEDASEEEQEHFAP